MADIPAILTSISTAIQITKDLREADNAIERAELRLKLSDVVNGLADAKLAIADLRDEIHTKDGLLKELQLALESQRQMVRHGDAYYVSNAQGRPNGNAYCIRCFENDHKNRQLITAPGAPFYKLCTTCGTKFESSRTQDFGA